MFQFCIKHLAKEKHVCFSKPHETLYEFAKQYYHIALVRKIVTSRISRFYDYVYDLNCSHAGQQ
jgi:hypothetical protein